jgi:hypothetical protein
MSTEQPNPEGGPIGPWIRPSAALAGELSSLAGAGLRADCEQQQQQQQQQQKKATLRRFLDTETMLPQEEVVTRLVTEVKQINKVAPREG